LNRSSASPIARHTRTWDRHQLVLDPAHQDAVLKTKRKAFHSSPAGRLEQILGMPRATLNAMIKNLGISRDDL
jgi:hypothetical protein